MLSIVAVGLCLLVGEWVVRSIGAAPDVKSIELGSHNCVYKRSTNPVLGFELKANYVDANPDFIESYERTNSHGQRDRPRSLQKPAGVKRILLLGDSVVEGYGLPEDHTIAHLLEQRLGPNTEVLNFGVSAYCTRAEIELLEVKGLRFDPDIVVLVFVENDFDNFNREAFPLGGTIERPAMVDGLFRRSHLFRMACTEWNLFHYGIEVDPIAWNTSAIGNNNVVAGIERFADLARRHEFEPLVAVWPRFLNEEIVDVGYVNDEQGTLIIEHLAAMNGVPAVRLSTYFQRHRKKSNDHDNPRLTYTLGDELHPSKQGSRIAAQAIEDALDDLTTGRLSAPPITAVSNDRAIELAGSLGADQPNYSRVHDRLGTQLLAENRITEAIAEFEKAIDADPTNAAAYNNLGVAYERGQHDSQAIGQFKRALEVQPDFPHANFNLARAFLRTGKRKLAIAGLKRTIELDPHHVQALTLLGRELGMQRRLAGAQMYLERAISVDPDHGEAHNNLGVIYGAIGKRDQAVFHFREALRIDPTNERAKANLGAMQSVTNRRP